MIRLLICALAGTLLLAACGKQPAAPDAQPQAEAAPAAQQSAPAPEAEPPQPAGEPKDPTGSSDGETVEATTVATSPVAAAVAATTPAPAAAVSSLWKEGENFTVFPVAQPVSTPPGSVEIVEVFWYGCAHCYALEPQLEAWERSKPAWQQLKRLPVIWNEVTREDARLYFTIEGLGLIDKLHPEVFRELHVRARPLTVVANNRVDTAATEAAARKFLLSHGVSAEDFGRFYRSFSIENKLRQAENMSRRYMLDHTPMIIVQGKYVTDISMAGGPDKLFQLINDLATRERGAS